MARATSNPVTAPSMAAGHAAASSGHSGGLARWLWASPGIVLACPGPQSHQATPHQATPHTEQMTP